jgi:hypothetical protein
MASTYEKVWDARPLDSEQGLALTQEQDPDLRLRSALGGTRTPNLLIRREVRRVQPVHHNPNLQVRVHQASNADAVIRCRPTSL